MLTAFVSRVVLSFKIVKYFIISNKKYSTDATAVDADATAYSAAEMLLFL